MAKNLNLGNFDNFEAKYLQIWIFFWKIGFIQIEGHILY